MRPLQVGAYAGVRPPLDAALAGVRASEAAGFDAVWWSSSTTTEDFRRAGAEPPIAKGWGLLHYVPTRIGREQGLRMAAAVPDSLLESYFMWGTPDDIVERLRPFRDAGLEHVYLANVTALGDHTKAASSAALLAEILAGLRRCPDRGPMRNGGGAGLITVRQVPATAARESNP